jgi:hypothetical protein
LRIAVVHVSPEQWYSEAELSVAGAESRKPRKCVEIGCLLNFKKLENEAIFCF